MKLTPSQTHLLRLMKQGADGEGWAKVSTVVMPLLAELPADLFEIVAHEDGSGKAKLTEAGEAVVLYT